jgi:hypothetical protein
VRWIFFLGFSAGCFSPSFKEGRTPCSQNQDCPPDFHCAADSRCWRNGNDPMLDLSAPADLGSAGDGGGPTDQGTLPDLAPILFPPATVWTSGGGGTGVGSASGAQLGLTFGDSPLTGTSVAPSGAVLTFSYFSDDSD